MQQYLKITFYFNDGMLTCNKSAGVVVPHISKTQHSIAYPPRRQVAL